MIRLATLFLLFLAAPALAAGGDDDSAAGLIYGTVTWPNGETLTGFIRWDREEACWDDLFHSGYRNNPWLEFVDQDRLRAERRKEFYESHGLVDRIIYSLNKDGHDPIGWRLFLIRYGDIINIEINDGRDDFVTTADGSRHQIGGYGNDSGADLLVYSGEPEPREIKWNDLNGIEFFQAPAGTVPFAERLFGKVETTEGEFEGFIQWDQSECLSTDSLDGRDRDYRMGEIRAIARAPRQNASELTLKDGTIQIVDGSNDVDNGNRGIMVENPRWGRVTVPWKRFLRVTFQDGKSNGPGRESYANSGPLTGTVLLKEGATASGRVVFDLDEGWRWDLFNGSKGGFDYDIPFPLISEITPGEDSTCRVVLLGGLTLDLADNQDTGDGNGGVLVFAQGETLPQHILWDEIRSIHLDP